MPYYCASLSFLQESLVLDLVFSCQHWQEIGVWEDPCIRIGWIQGLRTTLQHPNGLSFFIQAGEFCASIHERGIISGKDNMLFLFILSFVCSCISNSGSLGAGSFPAAIGREALCYRYYIVVILTHPHIYVLSLFGFFRFH